MRHAIRQYDCFRKMVSPGSRHSSLAKKQTAARDALAKFPTKGDVARNNVLDPYWSLWGAAYGGGGGTDGNAGGG